MSNLIERFSPNERFPHMTMAICFILLAVSGLGLFSKDWSYLTNILGGPFAAKWIHLVAGGIFASCNLYFIFRYGGQKVLFRVTMSLGLSLAVTGLFMWFPKILPNVLMVWFYPLYALLALGLMATIMGHIYMAIWFIPDSSRSMWWDGMVEEAWMKYHHRKYYDYKTSD